MSEFDPLDFIDKVSQIFDVELPTDKLSFHQVAVLFTLIIRRHCLLTCPAVTGGIEDH